MTLPYERTRNLLQAGAFLKELEVNTKLPESIRWEARRLLRHYPTLGEVTLLAAVENKFAGSYFLTPDIDPSWFNEYPLGPYTG